MKKLLKKHAEKLRFGIVGVANTAIDFGTLFILVKAFELPAIGSNYISTSVALLFSFFANKKFTFKNAGKNHARQFVVFLVITLFGLWIMQPLIIFATSFAISGILNSSLALLLEKAFASIASLIWNYLMYRKFVFNEQLPH